MACLSVDAGPGQGGSDSPMVAHMAVAPAGVGLGAWHVGLVWGGRIVKTRISVSAGFYLKDEPDYHRGITQESWTFAKTGELVSLHDLCMALVTHLSDFHMATGMLNLAQVRDELHLVAEACSRLHRDLVEKDISK